MTLENNDDNNTKPHLILTRGLEISHYRLLNKIGAGGMGEVWLAEDSTLKRSIALKFLPQRLSDDEEFRRRFLREARAAAALNHPSIITIHEISEHNGQLYIAMEFLEGESLEQKLTSEPPDFGSSINIIVAVCQGLSRAHERGILHRDIKPDNIFLTRDGQTKLLDFGLAKIDLDSHETQTGVVMGTTNYMSPEQGQGHDVDFRSDIFSLGVVLYRLLAGELPFQRNNIPATIHAIVHTEHPSLSSIRPDLPPECQTIIDRLLAKKPDDRFQTINEVMSALQPFVSSTVGLPSIAAPVPSRPKAKSLGVLYLRNLGSPDDEFLSYGITEDLIIDLTRIGSLRVAPMRKILKYKDSDAEPEEIARQLDVGMILDGSIHKSEKAIRVSAQLIEASTGENLWADRWEESPDNLPSIKQALAKGISSVLEVGTVVMKQAEVGQPLAHSPKGYELYLRGKYTFDRKKDRSDIDVALGLYRRALSEEGMLVAARYGIAEIHIYQGAYDQAIDELKSAREDAMRKQSRPDEAAILRLMARAKTMQSNWDEAYELVDEARRISATINDRAGEAEAIGSMIEVLIRRARFDETLKWFERVVEISLDLDDLDGVSDAYKNMGNTYFRTGEYAKARELYEKAIGIARQRNNLMLEAKCTANIGLTLSHACKLEEALVCYERALDIYDRLDEKAGTAIVFNNIALIHSSNGKYNEAVEMYEQAAEIHAELGNRSDYALVGSNKARLLAIIGEYDDSIAAASEALDIAGELDYPFVKNLAEDSIGYVYQCIGEYTQAAIHYDRALTVAREKGLRREAALAMMNLGAIYYYLLDYEKAKENSHQANELAHELGEEYAGLKAQAYLAAVEVRQGQVEKGLTHLREALQNDEQFGDPRNILDAQRLLGSLLIETGANEEEKSEGKQLLQRALAFAIEKNVVYEVDKISALLKQDA